MDAVLILQDGRTVALSGDPGQVLAINSAGVPAWCLGNDYGTITSLDTIGEDYGMITDAVSATQDFGGIV